MELQSSATWTSRKWRKRDCCIRRQVHRTMQAQKCGVTNHMIPSLISGRWDACYTSRSPWSPRSALRTCKASTRKYFAASTPKSQTFSPTTLPKRLSTSCKLRRKWGRAVRRSLRCQLFAKRSRSWCQTTSLTIKIRSWTCWARSGCQRICFILRIDYPSHSMTLMSADAASKKKCCVDVHTRVLTSIMQRTRAITIGGDPATKDQRLHKTTHKVSIAGKPSSSLPRSAISQRSLGRTVTLDQMKLEVLETTAAPLGW